MNRSMRRDDGFAMAAVMGAIALITVLTFGGFYLAQTSLHSSQRVAGESRAFQVAESGLDRELAIFSPVNVGTEYYPKYGSTPDGQYTITVDELNSGSIMGEYLMTSRGVSQNASESVSMRFFYLDLWKMNISAGDPTTLGGGRGWQGQAEIHGPMYVRGSFEWWAAANYEEGPLLIRDGNLIMGGNGKIGYEKPIDLYVTGTYPTNELNKRLFVNRISHTVPDVDLPWIDDEYMDKMYEKAIAESIDNNMGSESRAIATTETIGGDPATYATALAPALNPRPSAVSLAEHAADSRHYKYIGDRSGRAALGEGVHHLVIDDTSFGAWEGNGYPPTSGLHDDFAYDKDTGTLYVEGTVFIDGDLTLGGKVRRYKGNGTLVVNGDVSILTELGPEQGSLSPEQAIGICAPGNIYIGASNCAAYYHGAIFCNGTAGLYGTHTRYRGSMLAGNIYGDKPNISLHIDPDLPSALPESMPAAGGGMVFSGQWTRR